MSQCRRLVLSLVILDVLAATALAQDAEPNDACPGQEIGAAPLPFTVHGSLDTPPDVPDVDVFRFNLPPGIELTADLEGAPTSAGTLEDPLLGLFDSTCTLLNFDDDGGVDTNSRLIVSVPDDGVVILAVTAYEDLEFTGNGFYAGSYTLTVAEAPGLIHSISGRLADAQDGRPLTGEDPTFATVSLLHCEASECSEVGFVIPDPQGGFTFDGERLGLRAGDYRIAASADGYAQAQPPRSEVFRVSAGERYEFGDFLLDPDPLQITDLELCGPTPAGGGVCAYAVHLRNRSDKAFSGRVWSLVDYFLPESEFTYAFQVGAGNSHHPQPKYVWLSPGESERVAFYLRIPPVWPALDAGGFACISIGIGRAPFAVYSGEAAVFIGCLTRDANGYELSPPEAMATTLKARGRMPFGTKRAPPGTGSPRRR